MSDPSPEERRATARRRTPSWVGDDAPPPHGTRARYLVHVAARETPCRGCLRAEANDLHMVMSVNIANEQAARDRMAMLLRWLS